MIRTLILGSCVSRDALSMLRFTQWQLDEFVARQSWISHGSRATVEFPGELFTSPWQRKSLAADFIGNGLETLESWRDKVDVVLIDLVDERQGVLELADGSWITNNYELQAVGALKGLPVVRHLECGTDEHFRRWRTAADHLLDKCEEWGLRDRLLLVAPAFATTCDDAETFPAPQGRSAEQLETTLSRYMDHLRDRGVTTARVPRHRLSTSTTHRWGPAPFHYNNQSEYLIRQSIRARVRYLGWPASARALFDSARSEAHDAAASWEQRTGRLPSLRRRRIRVAGQVVELPRRWSGPVAVELHEATPTGFARGTVVRVICDDVDPTSPEGLAPGAGIVAGLQDHADAMEVPLTLRGMGRRAALAVATATMVVPHACALVQPHISRERSLALREWWEFGHNVPAVSIGPAAADSDAMANDALERSWTLYMPNRDSATPVQAVDNPLVEGALFIPPRG